MLEASDVYYGYDWCSEILNGNDLPAIASEVELSKAELYIQNKEINKSIEVYKNFEKKEQEFKSRAATNLAFLTALENDKENALHYANMALETEPYNSSAYINKGFINTLCFLIISYTL